MIRHWRSMVAAVYAALLVVVSVLPPTAEGETGWDSALSPQVQNWLHVPAYIVLFILVASAAGLACRGRAVWVLAALACVAFGSALECIQAAIPGRMGSLTDALLNAGGVVLGVVMMLGRGGCAVCSLVTRGLGCPPPDADKKPEDS